MFLKILKWIGITLGFLVVIIACTYVYASVRLNDRQEKTYDVKLPTIEVKHDSATLALGKHLVLIKGCTECHGDNLGGKIIMDDPSMGKIAASNLTRGAGGIPEDYTTKDWVKAIVYGLGKNNKSIIGMPSKEFSQLLLTVKVYPK
jgi:hypothetical protein